MKTWILSAAVLAVAAIAQAEELLLPSLLEPQDEFSLDFSEAEFFAPPTPVEAEWLPPPMGLRDEPCKDGNCVADFTCKDKCTNNQPCSSNDVFATLAFALANEGSATHCANIGSCGTKCKCASGDATKPACGDKCACGVKVAHCKSGSCKTAPCKTGTGEGSCKVAACKSGCCKAGN